MGRGRLSKGLGEFLKRVRLKRIPTGENTPIIALHQYAETQEQSGDLAEETGYDFKLLIAGNGSKDAAGLLEGTQDNTLFIPISRDEVLNLAADESALEELIEMPASIFSAVTPVEPREFPSFEELNPEVRGDFHDVRRRDMLDYNILFATKIFMHHEIGSGVLLLHPDDVAYAAWYTRQHVAEWREVLVEEGCMEDFGKIPAHVGNSRQYREYSQALENYALTVGERIDDNWYKYHEPIPIEKETVSIPERVEPEKERHLKIVK